MKTVFDSRTLWFDGTQEISASQIPYFLLSGVTPDKIICQDLDEELKSFNSIFDESPISAQKASNLFDLIKWNVPEEYLRINLDSFFHEKNKSFLLERSIEHLKDEYSSRVYNELQEITKRNLQNLFRCLIFLTDHLKANKIVWGVGRGSSCACFCLFLLKLHLVDPVKYGIPLTEFFHD